MSTHIVPFLFESHEVRGALDNNGVPWLVAKDVAVALGYDQTSSAIKLCKRSSCLDELNKINGLPPATKWIPEGDVYRLAMRSNLPSAERFQDWIADEVLPSIRKTGRYEFPSNTTDTPAPNTTESSIASLKLSRIAMQAAKAFGFKGNMAALSADRAVKAITTVSPLALMGQTALVAEVQEILLTASDIGERLGCSAIEANKRLTAAGFQVDGRDAKGKLIHELTDAGKSLGAYLDTGKKHGDGTPVTQTKWYARVLDALKAEA